LFDLHLSVFKSLLKLLPNWKNSSESALLDVARGMVAVDHRKKIGRSCLVDERMPIRLTKSDAGVDAPPAIKAPSERHKTTVPLDDMKEANLDRQFENNWYTDVLTSLFGGSPSSDDRNEDRTAGIASSPPNSLQCQSSTLESAVQHLDDFRFSTEGDERREEVDNDSTSSGTVSTLGRGLGDDLKSLPSVGFCQVKTAPI
jgi:hypothetical protein